MNWSRSGSRQGLNHDHDHRVDVQLVRICQPPRRLRVLLSILRYATMSPTHPPDASVRERLARTDRGGRLLSGPSAAHRLACKARRSAQGQIPVVHFPAVAGCGSTKGSRPRDRAWKEQRLSRGIYIPGTIMQFML